MTDSSPNKRTDVHRVYLGLLFIRVGGKDKKAKKIKKIIKEKERLVERIAPPDFSMSTMLTNTPSGSRPALVL